MQTDSNPPFVKNCWTCNEPMTFQTWTAFNYTRNCHACDDKAEQERNEQVKARLAAHWRTICPSDFQTTDPERLPCREATQQAAAWSYSKRGLLLHGKTGTGKSRCAWMILEKFHMAGRKVEVLNSLSGVLYAAKFSESAAKVERWLDKMIHADILFMDDIFKNKLTDSFEGAIFSIIDQRTENGRPMIVTANDTGSTLASRMSEDRGEPLIRRLREFCDTITFTK